MSCEVEAEVVLSTILPALELCRNPNGSRGDDGVDFEAATGLSLALLPLLELEENGRFASLRGESDDDRLESLDLILVLLLLS